MSIQRVTPSPLRCCGGIDRHTVECYLFADLGPHRFVHPPARRPKSSNLPVVVAVLAVVAIVLVVAGVVWIDATATPARDAATVTPAAQAGAPVPQGCGAR